MPPNPFSDRYVIMMVCRPSLTGVTLVSTCSKLFGFRIISFTARLNSGWDPSHAERQWNPLRRFSASSMAFAASSDAFWAAFRASFAVRSASRRSALASLLATASGDCASDTATAVVTAENTVKGIMTVRIMTLAILCHCDRMTRKDPQAKAKFRRRVNCSHPVRRHRTNVRGCRSHC